MQGRRGEGGLNENLHVNARERGGVQGSTIILILSIFILHSGWLALGWLNSSLPLWCGEAPHPAAERGDSSLASFRPLLPLLRPLHYPFKCAPLSIPENAFSFPPLCGSRGGGLGHIKKPCGGLSRDPRQIGRIAAPPPSRRLRSRLGSKPDDSCGNHHREGGFCGGRRSQPWMPWSQNSDKHWLLC